MGLVSYRINYREWVRWESAGAPCSALYDRLVAKGKTPKLALIAVANKLLKQAFAIANSRIPYDPEYVSVRRWNRGD
jgi:hypothetical protein